MNASPKAKDQPGAIPVVPRVRLLPNTDVVRLDDVVERTLQSANCGAINLYGPQGSGKSMALRHLAGRFGDKLRLLDDVPVEDALALASERWVVFTTWAHCREATVSCEM